MPIIELKGLRGLSDLSSDEQNSFIQKQISAGVLSKNSSAMDADRLYRNGEFYKKYGAEVFNSMTPEERDEFWQNDLINEARKRDITKESVGEENYNKIMGLTPQGVLDLVDSGWNPDNYIHTPSMQTAAAAGAATGAVIGGFLGGTAGSAALGVGAVPGAAGGAWAGAKTGTWIGLGVGAAMAGIESSWNKDENSKLDNVVAKDNKRKEEMSSEILPQVSLLLNNVMEGTAFEDDNKRKEAQPVISVLQSYGVDFSKGEGSDVDKLFEKVVGKSTPYWEMFKDRHELSDITEGDKLSMIQKTLAVDLAFQDGGYSSMSINNQNIQDHISNNQSWEDWAFNTGKNVVVGTIGALGETVAGTAVFGAYAVDKVNSLIGTPTNYAKSILEGKNEQGDKMPLLLDLSYWDGVDKFNTFDPELIEKIRENGGISPYNNVSLAGEEGRFFSWQSLNEAIKMGKYALATRITSGILGSTSSNLAKFNARTANKLGLSAVKSEALGTFTNKWGSMGTYLAAGVPVAAGYGLGAYEDTKLNLTQKEDERQAKDFYDEYLKSDEYKERVEAIEKELLTPRKGGKEDSRTIYVLPTKEDARKMAEAQVQSEMARYFLDYVKNNRDELAESNPTYKANRDNIDRIAVDAYALDATIEGAKNTFVNLNFRNYLFNKSTTEMIKGSKGVTTPVRFNPKTGKIEQVSKGIDGQDVASNVKIDIGRAVGNQLWGGFISNYTDDVTTGFVEAGAEKRYDNYLKQKYNGKAVKSLANFMGNLYDVANAALQGADAKMRDPMSWYDGFIGALGSVTPGSGGIPRLSPYNNEQGNRQGNEQRSFGSKLLERAVRTTGIGATAYDTYYQNKSTAEAVNVVNNILEKKKLDLAELLNLASATNTSDISSENGGIIDAKTDRAKSLLTAMLYLEQNRDNPVVMAAPQLQRTIEVFDALRDKNFGKSEEHKALISNLAYEFLKQPENKDIASLPKEEAEAQAVDRVTHNLDKARTLINSMDEAAAEVRIANPKASPDDVGQMVTLKVMADQYKSRISEMEETLGLQKGSSLSQSLSVESMLARYPSKTEMQLRLETLNNMEKHISSEIEKVKSELKKRKGEDKTKERDKLTVLNRMQNEASVEKSLVQEALKSYFSDDSNTSNRVLSKEEIMALDARSRAVMLNSDEDTYTPNQRQVIREVLKEYVGNNILNANELFNDIATLKGKYDGNLELYSDYKDNPRLLLSHVINKGLLFGSINRESLLEAQSSYVKNSVDELRNSSRASGMTEDKISDSVYRTLRGSSVPMGVLEYMKDKEDFKDFSDEIKKAIDFKSLVSDIERVADRIDIEKPLRGNFNQNIANMLDRSSSKEDFLNELGKLIDSKGVASSAKVPYEKLLNEVEQLWNQKSATTLRREEAQKAAEEKLRKEQAEREAAREEAERKAAEAAAAGVTDADTETSNDRAAELAAQGLTEKDVTTNNEQSLSPEEIAKAAEEGEDVNLESPTLEQQAAKNPEKVDIVPAPIEDVTDQGNKLPEFDNNTLLGNRIFGYELDTLKGSGRQVPRSGSFFEWMNTFGVKLQDIIDNELNDILKVSSKLYPLRVKIERNATHDDAVQDLTFWVVEYTPEVASIHNNKLGGVINSNGKQYLMVGTMGYDSKIKDADVRYIEEHTRAKAEALSYFKNNPSERFFVDTSRHTEVQQITSGRLVRQLATDDEVQIRSISELLSDEARNPKGLTMGDLEWGIQYNNRMATVNVSEGDTIYPPSDGASNLGSVFLLIESANGNYIPAYIRPIRFSELKNGKLKTQINEFLNELTSPEYTRRLSAIKELVQLLNLTRGGDNILIGTPEKPTLSIVEDGSIIRTFNITDASFDKTKFLDSIAELDPRVNITTLTLSDVDSLETFDEAGALTTDLAKIGTSGASYNVYAMDADGNPIIAAPVENQAPTLDAGSDLAKAQRKLSSERMGNATYRKDANGNWYTETDKLVTDPRLIEQLNYRNLIRTRGLEPNKVIGMDEVFVINSDKDNPLVLVRRKGNQIFAMSKEGAVRTINDINAEQSEKARQERVQKELESEERNDEFLRNMSDSDKQRAALEGEDVDLGFEETLTDEQIVEQLNGNFESDKQGTAKEEEKSVDSSVKPPVTRKSEDTNKIGTKSPAELQSDKTANTALSIIKSKTYGKRAKALLKTKFPDMPNEMSKLESFLQGKHITTTGITDVEQWLDMVENCK